VPAEAGQSGADYAARRLGSRQVILNRQETFRSVGTTLLTLCSDGGTARRHASPGPPPASCSDVSYSWAMLATGPPRDAAFTALGCDGRWLVLDVGWPGGPSGCDGPSCNLNMATTHWFPTALCTSLPAVGP
jgi:hypothetical protein